MLRNFIQNKYKSAYSKKVLFSTGAITTLQIVLTTTLVLYFCKTTTPSAIIRYHIAPQSIDNIRDVLDQFKYKHDQPLSGGVLGFSIFYVFLKTKKYKRKWSNKIFTTLYNQTKIIKKKLTKKIPLKRKRKRARRLIKGKWKFIKRFLLKVKRRRRTRINIFLLNVKHHGLLYNKSDLKVPYNFFKKKHSKLRRYITRRRNFLKKRLRYHLLYKEYKLSKSRRKLTDLKRGGTIKLWKRFKTRGPKPLQNRFIKIRWNQIKLYKTKKRRSVRSFKRRYISWKKKKPEVVIFARTGHLNLRRFSSLRKKKKQRILYFFFIKKKRILYKTKHMFKILRRQFIRKTKFKTKKILFRPLCKTLNIRLQPRKHIIFYKTTASPLSNFFAINNKHLMTTTSKTCFSRSLIGKDSRAQPTAYYGAKSYMRFITDFKYFKVQQTKHRYLVHDHAKAFNQGARRIKKKVFKRHFFKKMFSLRGRLLTSGRRSVALYLNMLSNFTLREFVITHKNQNLYKQLYSSQIYKSKAEEVKNFNIYTLYNHSSKNDAHTNYTPLFFFNVPKQYRTKNAPIWKEINKIKLQNLYIHIKEQQTNKYKGFFIFFLLNFLENFLKKKIWLRAETSNFITKSNQKHINRFCANTMHLYARFLKLISIKELLEILFITFTINDLDIFLTFIRRRLEKSHFKKHRKILSILFNVIKQNKIFFSNLGVKGFSFDIRGKVGVSGNAKKRHIFFSFGKISNTSQNIKSYWKQTSVWTPTGQMGITCLIQY